VTLARRVQRERGMRCSPIGLMLLGAALGCDQVPQRDVGQKWVVGNGQQTVDWMTWSPDGGTLYAIIEKIPARIRALVSIDAKTHAVTQLASPVWSFPSPQLTPDGGTIFYAVPDGTMPTGSLVRARISGGTALGDVTPIANDPLWFAASPDGTRVAVVHATTSPDQILDLARGASVEIKFLEPVAFSPDSTHLFARNAAGAGPTHYALVDAATGNTEDIAYPDGGSIQYVLSWDGFRPRVVFGGLPGPIDIVTGQHVGYDSDYIVQAISGAPPSATYGYVWKPTDCLDPGSNPETGDDTCRATQWRLARIDLQSGVSDFVASDGDQDSFAVSADGRWLAFATTPDGAISVKSPPAQR